MTDDSEQEERDPTPLEEVRDMLRAERRRWWVGFLLLGISILSLGLAGVVVFNAEQTRTRDDLHAANERARLACESRQDFGVALRAVVNYATEPNGDLDLTVVPGFDELDPASQRYFENLTERLAVGSPERAEDFRAFVASLTPVETCPDAVG